MANGSKNLNKSQEDRLVLGLKLLILLVIVILPVSFMILDSSRFLLISRSGVLNSSPKPGTTAGKNTGSEFNLQIPISAALLGNKSTVAPAKLDSLFSNLKP